MKITSILLAGFIMGFGTANAADQFPTIPLKHKASIKCIYSILKSNGAVRSVDTYALDGFRSAIEFTFTDVKGEQSTTDILLSGVLKDGSTLYGYGSPDRQSEQRELENQQFLSSIAETLVSECHLLPAFDNLFPQPPPRQKWRREILSN